MPTDRVEKLRKEFFQMTLEERAAIARAMLEGAARYARRRKKAVV